MGCAVVSVTGSAVACVNGDWLCQCERAIFDPPPTESTPLDRSRKNLLLVIKPLRLCQIWCKSVHGGLLGEWAKYNENFIYLYLFSGSHLQVKTRRQIFMLDGSNDKDSNKDVPYVDIAPHSGGEIPSKPHFWGRK